MLKAITTLWQLIRSLWQTILAVIATVGWFGDVEDFLTLIEDTLTSAYFVAFVLDKPLGCIIAVGAAAYLRWLIVGNHVEKLKQDARSRRKPKRKRNKRQ